VADKTKITDALKKLDPKNDDHWTASKQPAMAAVEELMGDKTITRADVDKAADGFTRDTAPGFFMTVGGEPAKPWEQGASQKADGTTEPSEGQVKPEERSDVSEEIAEASEQAPDANAPGSQAASTAETPRAVEALTGDLEPEEAAAVEEVGSAEPWNDYLKSGEDRPVPIDSPEGQAVVQDPRNDVAGEVETSALRTSPDVADELPGQNADGEVSGVRKPALTYDPRNRDDVATAGLEADNVDVDGKPSGVPTPISDGDFSLHPPTLNPESSEQVLPGTAGTTGASTASEQHESPRGVGIGDGEAEQSSLGGSGTDADEIEALEEELRSREEAIADLRMNAEEAGKAWREAEQEADKVRNRIAALRPKNSDTQTVKAYLESQKRLGQQRGEARHSLKEAGVSLKSLQKAVQGAPIDQAFARKNARGGQRPSRR